MNQPDAQSPADCADMGSVRAQIDRLDADLVQLLAQRAGYIDRAAELKAANGWPARIPERVEQVIANARAAAGQAGLDPALAEALWQVLVEWSIVREARTIPEN
ncbi:chorismate mutase [Sedimentitalea nanhaiensis]|uniref:chorismate mutase n=1 Tax=Sedimentitalea nanhaiensis TaxID=999627 RepID=A0A1I7AX12_9RHOB|nr:chorismate mutase [Sedimentitalea nanhaiensis]SFT79430.1 chorismate mutase [Sedimentitalea nanhaiensis]SFU21178.1 isochorismate pyruvate lyase [Sedimentitalea nanhaiensis]